MSRRIATLNPKRQPSRPRARFPTRFGLALFALAANACTHSSSQSAPVDATVSPSVDAGAPHGATRGAVAPHIVFAAVDASIATAHVVDAGAAPANFFGDEHAILAHVCDAAIARIERNRGGSTVSFRTWFQGGMRGLFKPQQRSEVANFRAELAAYRLSHVLGLGRVPPGCGRRLPREMLQHVADASGDVPFSQRVMNEMLARGDEVPGAMLYWVPGPLEPVPGVDRWATLLDLTQTLAPDDVELAADLSRLIVFDFVTDNVDRWSGGNILRQHLNGQAPGPMLFMDNGAAFSVGASGMGARPADQSDRLAHVQRFSRSLIDALRALTPESVRAVMAEDPLGPLLGDPQIHALLARRDRVIAHVDELARARGESAVLVFP